MRFIDLCAGIGGFSLGLTWAGMACAGQVEIDGYCNRVLEKHWPSVPKWGGIKTLDPAELPAAELVCGGYPCQPFSHAGKRRGEEDDRHLWPFVAAIVAKVRPAWCLFENVAGHITLGLDSVLSDLEALGYAAGALVVPACAVNAPHRRDRVWIVARDTHGGHERAERGVCQGQDAEPGGGGADVANTDSIGCGRQGDLRDTGEPTEAPGQWPPTEPGQPGQIPPDVANAAGADVRVHELRDDRKRPQGNQKRGGKPQPVPGAGGEAAAYPNRPGCEERDPAAFADGTGFDTGASVAGGEQRGVESCVGRDSYGLPPWLDGTGWTGNWEMGIPRVNHGVSNRAARLRALGNAVVPQVVYEISRAIMGAHYGMAADRGRE